MESSNVTESYIPPDNRVFGLIIAGGLFEFAVFAALWIVFDSPKMAAALWLFVHLVILSMGIGAFAMHKAQSGTIERVADAMARHQIAPPEIIDAQVRQLPAPSAEWATVDDAMFRRENVERLGGRIWLQMYARYNADPESRPRPTRENIKSMFPDLKSNGMITAAMEYLREQGVVTGGGQGREYEWV